MGLKQLMVLVEDPISYESQMCCRSSHKAVSLGPGNGFCPMGASPNPLGLDPSQLMCGICLVTVFTGARPCGGPFCTVTTLNRRPAVLLACAVICLTVAVLVPHARGLARFNGKEVMGVAAVAGGGALLGIAVLPMGAVIVPNPELRARIRRGVFEEADDARSRTPFPTQHSTGGDPVPARRRQRRDGRKVARPAPPTSARGLEAIGG
jgi:hypothetical protein